MDLQKFQIQLNELVNGAMASNLPPEFVASKLDMVSFEIKFRYMTMLANQPKFTPKVVIEEGGSKN
jgi:hypothetical protein